MYVKGNTVRNTPTQNNLDSKIKYYKQLAISKGGECLSGTYERAHSKLKWKCSKEHIWEATPDNINHGKWCPQCAPNKKLSLKELQDLAIERGGKCLSSEYINSKTKLEWECSEGHRWVSVASSIKVGTWCPQCAIQINSNRQKLTIDEMNNIAMTRGGKCLSKTYVNSKEKLEWECSIGHLWLADAHSIKHGTWCPECSGTRKLTIEDMYKVAKDRSGKCHSTEYTNAHVKLNWECAEGHRWSASPGEIRTGSWCPKCAGTQKLDSSEMYRVAESRGGKCLANEYINTSAKLKWECSVGHKWEASLRDIKSGRWCPDCSSGLGERICKEYFEKLFEKPFDKIRPAWLLNETGFSLELDGYNESLKLAFEHQGRQHYEHRRHYHDTKKDFDKRKNYDLRKKQKCEEYGVKLIEVPEIFHFIQLHELMGYIVDQCERNNIKIPSNWRELKVDLKNAYSPRFIDEMKQIAIDRGGICFSDTFLGVHHKLKWVCSEGHKWEAMPSKIKSGQWCPICGKVKRAKSRILFSINDLEKFAKSKKGKCLTKEYINSKQKILWECQMGHQWQATRAKVFGGQWCPVCSIKNRKKTTNNL